MNRTRALFLSAILVPVFAPQCVDSLEGQEATTAGEAALKAPAEARLSAFAERLRSCLEKPSEGCAKGLVSERFAGLSGEEAKRYGEWALTDDSAQKEDEAVVILKTIRDGDDARIITRRDHGVLSQFMTWSVQIDRNGNPAIVDSLNHEMSLSRADHRREVLTLLEQPLPSGMTPAAREKVVALFGKLDTPPEEIFAAYEALPDAYKKLAAVQFSRWGAANRLHGKKAGAGAVWEDASLLYARTKRGVPATITAWRLADDKQFDRADQELADLVAAVGPDPQLTVARAFLALRRGALDEATAIAKEVIAADPTLVAPHNVLTDCAIQRRDFAGAVNELRFIRDDLGNRNIYYSKAAAAARGPEYVAFIATDVYLAFKAEPLPPPRFTDERMTAFGSELVECINGDDRTCWDALTSDRFAGYSGQVAELLVDQLLRPKSLGDSTLVRVVNDRKRGVFVVTRRQEGREQMLQQWRVAKSKLNRPVVTELLDYYVGTSIAGSMKDAKATTKPSPSLGMEAAKAEELLKPILGADGDLLGLLEAYDKLPPALQALRQVRLLRLRATDLLAPLNPPYREARRDALVVWSRTARDFPSVSVALGFAVAGDFARAYEEIAAIETELGADSALDIARSQIALEAKKPGEARRFATAAVKATPDMLQANLALFEVNVTTGDYDAAVDCLRKARPHPWAYISERRAEVLGEKFVEFVRSPQYKAFESGADGAAKR